MGDWYAVELAAAALATYRLARLIAYDEIFAWLRERVAEVEDVPFLAWLNDLVNCPYCLGVWFAVAMLGLLWAGTPVTLGIVLVLGVAGAQDFLESASRGDRD